MQAGMKISISSNFPEVARALDAFGPKVRSATREALNRTLEWAETDVVREMRNVFDRPMPFTLRSLRKYYANTATLEARLWFRQRGRDEDKYWARTQIAGGQRDLKPMELRLQRARILPSGWFVVPGDAAPMDAYGNMSRGEISRILNVLGTYTESGYNKANAGTVARLRKGNAKKSVYGFEYFFNPPGARKQGRHLLPGVYRRVYTAFGQSLKPMLVFVNRARYRQRLDLFGIVQRTTIKRFPGEFDKALHSLLSTGSASAARRAR